MSGPEVALRLGDFFNRLAVAYLELFQSDEIRDGEIAEQLMLRHMYEARFDMIKSCARLVLGDDSISLFQSLIENSELSIRIAESQHDKEIEMHTRRFRGNG